MHRHFPNFLTLMNLASGSASIYFVLAGRADIVTGLFIACVILDFSDGFFARLLKVKSDMGKQLDSLADIVSFGLLPATMIFVMIRAALGLGPNTSELSDHSFTTFLQFSVLIVPMIAALRLARFNLSEESDTFTGLPTPAFALFWVGIYLDFMKNQTIFGQSLNAWFIFAVMMVMTLHMIVPVPMLSLKFHDFRFKPNFMRYLLLAIAVIILALTGIAGLPLVILTYILLSLLNLVLT